MAQRVAGFGPGSRGSFKLKLVATILVVALGDTVFWHFGQTNWGLVIVPLPLIALVARRAVRNDWCALTCFALAMLLAFAVILTPNLLAWGMFWMSIGAGTLMPAAARRGDAWQWAQRIGWHGARSCVAPWLDLWRVLKLRRRGRTPLRAIVPQFVLPVLGSLVILVLFTAANPVIENVLTRLTDLGRPDLAPERLMMWPIFFTLAWSPLRPRALPRVLGTFDGTGDLVLPGVDCRSVLLSLRAFNTLFAMQNLMDLAWLWGLAPLPRGITLAGYAHRGAYPLIVTALLAAGFVLVALRPGSQTASSPAIRRLVVVWVMQNVLLVANAGLRTIDYVTAYSLTALRIAALLWMALVALGLMLVLWRILQDKTASWLINANAAAALVMLTVCSFVDLDALAARYNIARARELGGRGAPLDMCYLERIGASALVPLAELERRQAPPAIHLWARLLRANAQGELMLSQSDGRWSLLGAMRLAAVPAEPGLGRRPLNPATFPSCQSRDVHALRVALRMEPPSPPVAAQPLTAAVKP